MRSVRARLRRSVAAALGLLATGCIYAELMGRNVEALFRETRRVPDKLDQPLVPDARLSVVWVGHATALVQIDDRVILTDPVFTTSVGQLSHRLVEPGIDVRHVPPLDAVLVSHVHFDHLSLGSLELLQDRVRFLALPKDGLSYLTDFAFPAKELPRWHSTRVRGLTITAVPVGHTGFRYGVDKPWMDASYTGYVVQHHGVTVYFPGDTSLARAHFAETARRFPRIDLALLPIAPIHPRDFMASKHMDPEEAVEAFEILGARHMIPIHFDTFENSLDEPGEARSRLLEVARRRGLSSRISVLAVGERVVLSRKPDGRSLSGR